MSVRAFFHSLRIWRASSQWGLGRRFSVKSRTCYPIKRFEIIRPFSNTRTITPPAVGISKFNSRIGFRSRLLGGIIGAICCSSGTPNQIANSSSLPGASDTNGDVVIPEKGVIWSSLRALLYWDTDVKAKSAQAPSDEELNTIDLELLEDKEINSGDDVAVGLSIAEKGKNVFLKGKEIFTGALSAALVVVMFYAAMAFYIILFLVKLYLFFLLIGFVTFPFLILAVLF